MSAESHPCLLLAYDYTALRVIDFRQAFRLIFTDKVEVITEFKDKVVKTVSKVFKMPAVIRLLSNFKLKFSVKLTRKNIFIRDRFICQYCGVHHQTSKLTIDHVEPRSRGGKSTWDNLVTACYPCNSKKGDRTPREANMALRGGHPRRLDMFEYINCLVSSNCNYPEWEDWIRSK